MESADGRHRRRQRNRAAVVDALLDLIRDGTLDPSAAEVAARAGLSERSLFRYFDDVDDLCRAAIARQYETVAPILAVAAEPAAPLAERAEALVGQRVALYESMGHVGTVARLRAPFQPLVAEQLRAARALLRDRLATTFAAELRALDPRRADALLAAADVLVSFEAYRLLRDDHGRSVAEASAALGTALTALLAPAELPIR